MLQAETGAELVGIEAPDALGRSLSPSKIWGDGDEKIATNINLIDTYTWTRIKSYLLPIDREGLLFTGDHILQGTTSVILPPDGDMGAYLCSLQSLKDLPLRYLAPGQAVMDNPAKEIQHLINHRMKRERKVYRG